MTDETETQIDETQQPEETPEAPKLLIDNPTDFKFHAAYMAYSDAWDKIESATTRNELNGILTALSKDEMSYQNFYSALDDYRRGGSKHDRRRYEFSRDRIETQRKRDWRHKQNKQERNSRYRKH